MNNQNTTNKQIEEIDIKELIIKILHKWYVFVIAGIFCLSFAIYYIFSTPPQFSTSGTVLIRSDKANISSLGEDFSMMSDVLNANKLVDDEIIVFKSKTILKQMVEELMLQTDVYYKKRLGGEYLMNNNEPLLVIFPEDFKKTLVGSLVIDVKKTKEKTWKVKFVYKIGYSKTKFNAELSDLTSPLETPWGTFRFIENEQNIDPKYPLYQLKYVTIPLKPAIEKYSNSINISLSNKKANAINIAINGGNISRNEDIINKMIELYERDALMDKNKTSLQMSVFIDERINLLNKELSVIEDEVEEYRIKNNLANLSEQARMAIETASQYEHLLTEVDMEYNLMIFIENYILKSDIMDLIPTNTGTTNQSLSSMILSHNEQIMEYLRLTYSTNEQNPFISQLKDKITLSRQNILQTITNAKEGINIRRQDIIAKNRLMNKELSSVPSVERKYIEIAQQQNIKRNLYLFLLNKREDVQLALASNTNTSKIVDAAYTSVVPTAPNKKMILLIAIFFAGVIGLIYIYIDSLINNKVEDKKMLRSLTKVPLSGTIPLMQNSTSNVVMRTGEITPESEAFRALRTNLKFTFKQPTDKTILVTSSHSGEGKTFISINLAISLAMINKKVALVGLDIRLPKLAEYLNLKATPGITDFLSEPSYTEDDIRQVYSDNANLNVYVAGSLPPNPSELLTNQRLNSFFDYLKNNYDYIIIDSAPIGLTSDSLQLTQFSDAIFYVCRQKVTQRAYIHSLNALVEEGHLNNVSIILNGATHQGVYGYGYSYGYGYGYGAQQKR